MSSSNNLSRRVTPLALTAFLLLGVAAQAKPKEVFPEEKDTPPPPAAYHPGNIGLGFMINPFFLLDIRNGLGLGPTVKYVLPSPIPVALQATLGIGGIGSGVYGGEIDILYEAPRIHDADSVSVNWYAGLGATIGVVPGCALDRCPSSSFGGVRGVLGMGWLLKSAPLEAVVEWRPGVLFVPVNLSQTYVAWSVLSFSAGARYFF